MSGVEYVLLNVKRPLIATCSLIVLYIYYLPKGFSAYKNIDKNVIKINFSISSVLHISIELVLLVIIGIKSFIKAFM